MGLWIFGEFYLNLVIFVKIARSWPAISSFFFANLCLHFESLGLGVGVCRCLEVCVGYSYPCKLRIQPWTLHFTAWSIFVGPTITSRMLWKYWYRSRKFIPGNVLFKILSVRFSVYTTSFLGNKKKPFSMNCPIPFPINGIPVLPDVRKRMLNV